MCVPEDPYFAGRISDKSGKRPGSGEPPPLLGWSCVYAANLIVPGFLGWMVTQEGGRFGMVIGISVVFALGWRVCYVSRSTVLTVVYGGWIVAASQLFPILQIFAGVIGMVAAGPMRGENGNVNTALGGFIATLVTGFILITVAVAFGSVMRGIASLVHGAKALEGEPSVV